MILKFNLNDLYLFATLVNAGGFTAAARSLNIPKSRFSRRISELEEALGARLLHRTTRAFSLTEAGKALYEHSKNVIEAASAGENAVLALHSAPTGLVRLTAPLALGQSLLAQTLAKFLVLYPEIRVELNITNEYVDMVSGGYDLAIRGIDHSAHDSSLVQVNICSIDWVFVASPFFLEGDKRITHPSEITRDQLLVYSKHRSPTGTITILSKKREAYQIKVSPRLISNSFVALKAAALNGLGIAGLPPYLCSDEVLSGSLIVHLPNWVPRLGQIVALFPSKKGLAPATRVLLDYLKREIPTSVLTSLEKARISRSQLEAKLCDDLLG